MRYETYHNSFFHCYIPYIRYGQWLAAKTEEEKAQRWQQLRKSTWGILVRGFNTGLYSCHANVARAMIARVEGRHSKAERLLRKAADQARFTDSVLGMFMVARERARLERALGFEDRAQYEAGVARRLAQKQNQVFMLRQLEMEFGASKEAPVENAPSVGTMSRRSTRATVTEQIAFDALLKVSVAATRSVEPNLQAQMTLDEVIRVFGAERGYVFRWDENDKSLNFACGRDAAGAELPAPTGHSQTVINRVLESREPLVLTGSDQMEDIGAKSAVIHGLRSIMAVPLFLQESFKGLVYLDSRLAKNLFNESDVQLFEAVAGHIAVAFEVSSMATLERQKAAFQKDLEVSGTVQRMFLPSGQTISHGKIAVAAFYRPAAQCGGDWWWHAEPTEDMIRVVVGDVTGHGAGPAMITALAATVARTSSSGKPEGSVAGLFRALDENIHGVAGGEYWMTAMGLEIDMKTRALQIVGASGPPAFTVSREGALDTILSTSSPLGEGRGDPHVIDLKVKEGDRLVIFTDGIVETRNAAGRVYGYRRLAQVLTKMNGLSAAACSEALVADLDKFRGELEQDDDMTFLIVDIAR